MRKVLVAATRFEIADTISFLEEESMAISDQWDILITGIGSMLTTYSLTRYLSQATPALVIQAGIAGSFTIDQAPGSIVLVSDEQLGDLGVTERGLFKDVFEMGFINPNDKPFTSGNLSNPDINKWQTIGLPLVKGVTVNEVTTTQQRIEQLKQKYACEVETMEGAALHYVCLQEQIPFLQLRAISNFVGERDKNNWQLRQSIDRLNNTLRQMIIDHSL